MDTESQAYNEFVIRNPFHIFLIISALVISRNFLNAFGASSLIVQEHISSVSTSLLRLNVNWHIPSKKRNDIRAGLNSTFIFLR